MAKKSRSKPIDLADFVDGWRVDFDAFTEIISDKTETLSTSTLDKIAEGALRDPRLQLESDPGGNHRLVFTHPNGHRTVLRFCGEDEGLALINDWNSTGKALLIS